MSERSDETLATTHQTVILTKGTPPGPGGYPRLAPRSSAGRYLILEEIGRGGMSVVYSAFDPKLDRKVAIKLLRSDVADPSVATSQLLREAQVLARLRHPNVISVHDVGTIDGQVFMAMELVEGETLREWLGSRERGWREVLSVLVDAGRGLAAAHDEGLVHRDFKPENVLVDGSGRVLVVDFGIARHDTRLATSSAMEDHSSDTAVHESGFLTVEATSGTPAYMAPEQLQGQPGTAGTDQYAFCVSLYEALYGARPFSHGDIERLGTGTTKALPVPQVPARPRVPRWVRRIVVRGLSWEKALRFPSMPALLVALARNPARTRHRLALTAVGILLLSVAVVGFARRHTAQAKLCRGAEGKLTGVWDGEIRRSVHDQFLASGRRHAADTSKRFGAVLDDYSRRWATQHRQACEATHVDGEQSESLLDLRMLCLRRRLSALKALAHLVASSSEKGLADGAVPAALALPRLEPCEDTEALALTNPMPEDPAMRMVVERLESRVDELRALSHAGRSAGVASLGPGLVEHIRQTGYRPLLAQALQVYGFARHASGHGREAERNLYEAVRVGAETKQDELVARSSILLIRVIGFDLLRPDDALALRANAEAWIARAGNDELLQAALRQRLGEVLRVKGRWADAQGYFEDALALRERILGPNDSNVERTLSRLAMVLNKQGEHQAARKTLRRSLKIVERNLGPNHPLNGEVLDKIARIEMSEGQLETAHQIFLRALALLEQNPDDLQLGKTLFNAGKLLLEQGKPAQALAYLERSRESMARVQGPDAPRVAIAMVARSQALVELRRYPEARRELHTALAIFEKMFKPDHPWTAEALTWLGRSHVDAGKPALGVPLLERAVEILATGENAELARARFELARALWASRRGRKKALTLATNANDLLATHAPQARLLRERVRTWLDGRSRGTR